MTNSRRQAELHIIGLAAVCVAYINWPLNQPSMKNGTITYSIAKQRRGLLKNCLNIALMIGDSHDVT